MILGSPGATDPQLVVELQLLNAKTQLAIDDSLPWVSDNNAAFTYVLFNQQQVVTGGSNTTLITVPAGKLFFINSIAGIMRVTTVAVTTNSTWAAIWVFNGAGQARLVEFRPEIVPTDNKVMNYELNNLVLRAGDQLQIQLQNNTNQIFTTVEGIVQGYLKDI